MKTALKGALIGLFDSISPPPRVRLSDDVQARLVANPLTIVDVGAVYGPDKRWTQLGPRTCRFISFEPDSRSQGSIDNGGSFAMLALPTAIGREAGRRTLHLAKGEFASSLYPPNEAVLGVFATWPWHESAGSDQVTVDTLDHALAAYPEWRPDFIKTDIEGADLDALLGGAGALEQALGVQVEAAFVERNVGAPLFAEIDQHLRGRGFMLFQMIREHWLRQNGVRGVASRPQLIWADVIYFRDWPTVEARLKGLADRETLLVKLVAMLLVYGHFDYAADVVKNAMRQGLCPASLGATLEASITRSTASVGFLPRAMLATLLAAGVRLAAWPFGQRAREAARQLYARQAAPLFHHLYRESMRTGIDRSCTADLP